MVLLQAARDGVLGGVIAAAAPETGQLCTWHVCKRWNCGVSVLSRFVSSPSRSWTFKNVKQTMMCPDLSSMSKPSPLPLRSNGKQNQKRSWMNFQCESIKNNETLLFSPVSFYHFIVVVFSETLLWPSFIFTSLWTLGWVTSFGWPELTGCHLWLWQ